MLRTRKHGAGLRHPGRPLSIIHEDHGIFTPGRSHIKQSRALRNWQIEYIQLQEFEHGPGQTGTTRRAGAQRGPADQRWRGDVTAMSDALVEMSRSLRVLIATDFVTPETCERNQGLLRPRFGWPACFAVVTVAVAVCAIAIPIVAK